MAWKFLDSSKPSNKRYKEEMMLSINNWWAQFQNKRKNIEAFLDGRAHWDLEGFMAETLQDIDESLMWEFGTEQGGRYNLVITPETERHLRPLVETILENAPQIATWHFYGYRQPHGLEQTAELVADQTGIELDSLLFAASADDEHLIDLCFAHKDGKAPEVLGDAIFMACEYLLGEETLDRWIGDMSVNNGSQKMQPISELPNTIASLIEKMRSRMPDKPLAAMRDALEAAVFTAEPEEEDDSTERFDMVSATTCIRPVWEAAHSGSPFDSCRFSRHNEKFCYLKLAGLTDRAKIEELEAVINAQLVKSQSGCTTGSAVGTSHGYIDLCLQDVAKAIAVLRETCRSAGCPEQSWLQFFDADWTREWVGISAGAMTPPGMIEH